MSRISSCLQKLADNNVKAVVPYIVAGDPDPGASVAVMHQLVADGADIIELGVPFSDPMAEGPVIQRAHERALVHNVSLNDTLLFVSEFRQKNNHTPIVLMGDANPLEAMGYKQFATKAEQAGVDAVLVVDLPPEEAEPLSALLRQKAIDIIYLIAPTTSEKRVGEICERASGYIYYVSLKGVTGAGHLDTVEVAQNVERIKRYTNLPVCVGFGIKDAESAKVIASCADGIVVGSALVAEFENFSDATENPCSVSYTDLLQALHHKFSVIASAVK